MLVIDTERVAALIVRCNPDVMIAGDEGLARRQVGEQIQAEAEVFRSADVTGQDEEIGRPMIEMASEKTRRLVAATAGASIVQVGGDGDAHRRSLRISDASQKRGDDRYASAKRR